jgi:hypothetical protein
MVIINSVSAQVFIKIQVPADSLIGNTMPAFYIQRFLTSNFADTSLECGPVPATILTQIVTDRAITRFEKVVDQDGIETYCDCRLKELLEVRKIGNGDYINLKFRKYTMQTSQRVAFFKLGCK